MLFTFLAYLNSLLDLLKEQATYYLSLRKKIAIDSQRLLEGLELIAWGFFKKLVISERFAIFINNVYTVPEDTPAFARMFACILAVVEVYCDFSGYSNIAIGLGKLLGINLSQNFSNPFFSNSMSEFWRRWHITLGKWFRDYVYIPLGGYRKDKLITSVFVLGFVFALSGLWHGASWNFVFWGLGNGFIVLLERLCSLGRNLFFRKSPDSSFVPRPLRLTLNSFYTMSVMAFFGVYFKLETINKAHTILSSFKEFSHDLFTSGFGAIPYFWSLQLNSLWYQGLLKSEVIVGLIFLIYLYLVSLNRMIFNREKLLTLFSFNKRIIILSILIVIIALEGYFDTRSAFYYFRF